MSNAIPPASGADGTPWLLILLIGFVCALVPVWVILARKRFVLGSVMIIIFFVAVFVAGTARTVRGDARGWWLEVGCFVEMSAYFLAGSLRADPSRRPKAMTDEQWREVDARILAGDPRRASRLVRAFTGRGTDEVEAIHLDRYRRLRAERSREFASTDEQYWRCFYD